MKKTNKILALSLAVAMLPTFSFAKQFSDVASTGTYKWAYSAIDELSNKNIIAGFNDGTYKPELLVSLPQTMSLLKGIMNPSDEEVTKARNTYGKDLINLGMDAWAIDAAAVCLQNNVITMGQVQSAKKNGQIGPGSTVYPARQDIAVFYAKALGLSKNADLSNLKHKDISNLSVEKKEYLSALVKAGIFSSTGSNGNFNGNKGIRRAEMAIITKAAYDYKAKIQVATAKGEVILASSTNGLNRFIIKDGKDTYSFEYNSGTKFTINGIVVDSSKLKEGQLVEVKYQKGVGEGVNGIATEITIKDVVTQYVGYVVNTYSNKLEVKYTDNSSSIDLKFSDNISTPKQSTFTLGTNPEISILGISSSFSYVKKDDMVEFSTDAQGYVTKMMVTPKDGSINGTLKEIGYVDSARLLKEITVTLKDNKDYKFYVRLDNNLKNPLIDNLRVGNTINAYTNYRFIGNNNNNLVGNNVVFGTITESNFDRQNYLTSIALLEYVTGRPGRFQIAQNAVIEIGGRTYPLNQFSGYNYNNLKSNYALVETNGNYVTKIKVFDNNSRETVYRVAAQLENGLQNPNNTNTFRIVNSSRISGGSNYSIDGQRFQTTGINVPNYGFYNNYEFIVVYDSYQIRPIMLLTQNSGYGYLR